MAFEVGGSKARVKPSINVTPLVDVVLVLLIIFMVITPMMVKQFWLHVPKKEDAAAAGAPQPNDQLPVVLSIKRDGSLRINKDPVTAQELPDRLARIFAARGDHLLFFDADDSIPYGQAMDVMDAARGGGAVHIAVLTEPASPDDE